MRQDPTLIEALQNLGRLIDTAIETFQIWEDGGGEQEALAELKQTRRRLKRYLREHDAKCHPTPHPKLTETHRTSSHIVKPRP